MKAAIQCAFIATLDDAEIKRARTGRDYLALTVTTLDEKEQIWVSGFHNHHMELCDALKPKQTVYIEGALKLVRWERDGVPQAAVRVTAEKIEVLFGFDARPKARKSKDTPDGAKQEAMPLEPAENTHDTRMRPATGLFQGPAAIQSGKRYERPFDDALPF